MKNALLAILLISPAFALVGTMIVHNKMAFFSDAIGHCALTGASLGAVLGFSNSSFSVLIFSIVFALGISYVTESEKSSSDTIIGVFSSAGMALGIVLLSIKGNLLKFSNFIIGDILSVSKNEIKLLALMLIITIVFWLLFFNKIMLSSLNKDLAISKQINTKLYKNMFLILIASIVSISISKIGILIINSLLTLPAASARNVARGMRSYHIFTLLFSLFSGISGLIFSFYVGVSSGASIILVSSLIFALTFFINRKLY